MFSYSYIYKLSPNFRAILSSYLITPKSSCKKYDNVVIVVSFLLLLVYHIVNYYEIFYVALPILFYM